MNNRKIQVKKLRAIESRISTAREEMDFAGAARDREWFLRAEKEENEAFSDLVTFLSRYIRSRRIGCVAAYEMDRQYLKEKYHLTPPRWLRPA